jgi:hypothetical protein
MKGMIFTEFLDMVEDRFGLAVVENIIEAAGSPSGGAYTAVGTYDHHEMVRMVVALSEASGISTPMLLCAYGEHLFSYFVQNYPAMFAGLDSTFDFMNNLDGYIHVEVRKLYADAELPRFELAVPVTDQTTELIYRSGRAFADLAEGLIAGCATHFGEQIEVMREDLSGGHGTVVRFTLTKAG